MDNWIENNDKTIWRHRYNPRMVVSIEPNTSEPRRGKYFIFHTHPGPHGVIPQPMESADLMKVARKKAEIHLRHWNDQEKWESDPDYGKRGK